MSRSEGRATVWLGLSAALLLAIRLNSRITIGDDAYMTFKNALNLMRGYPLSFNAGEHEYATSTPLYALTLALLGVVFGSEPVESYLYLNITLDLVNLTLLFFLLRRTAGNFAAALGAVIFALSWTGASASLIGMETPLFHFLLLAATLSCTAASKRAEIFGAVFAGFAIIARPEGVIFSAVFLIHLSRRDGRIPREAAAIIATIGGVWSLFAWSYFGRILPYSIQAKNIGYYRLPGEAIGRMLAHLTSVFVPFEPALPKLFTAVLASALLVTWLSSVRSSIRRNAADSPLMSYCAVVFFAYAAANPFMFDWYLASLEPGYIAGIATCAAMLVHQIEILSDPRRAAAAAALLYSSALLLAVSFIGRTGDPADIGGPFRLHQAECEKGSFIPRCLDSGGDRELNYVDLAARLEPEITPQTKVLAPEFGAFGYYSSAYIISSLGHIGPQAFPYLPLSPDELQTNNGIPLRMIKGLSPDYLFALDIFFARGVLQDEWFKANYELIESYPTKIWGSTGLLVFRRKQLGIRA